MCRDLLLSQVIYNTDNNVDFLFEPIFKKLIPFDDIKIFHF